jgi:hypothetical protein
VIGLPVKGVLRKTITQFSPKLSRKKQILMNKKDDRTLELSEQDVIQEEL